jgi:lipoprotein-releasing system ATP-binding protein
MNNPAMTSFALRDIHQSFAQAGAPLHVLRGAALNIGAGEVVALLGPSGSGKSALLHIAGLWETPSSGTVHINGTAVDLQSDTTRTALRRQHIGFIYQFHNLLPEFSALENVAMPARLAGRPREEAMAAAQTLLTDLGLGARLSHLPAQLSGGEQQRVAVARALINRPQIILADEPTGSLDGAAGAQVAALLVEMAQAQNSSVLLATHDIELAENHADRIVRMHDGVVVETAANPS